VVSVYGTENLSERRFLLPETDGYLVEDAAAADTACVFADRLARTRVEMGAVSE